MGRGWRAARGFVLLAVGLSACAGGPQFDGREYRDGDIAFRLGEPGPDLRRVDSTEARLAFQNDAAGATIAVHVRCGLDGDDVPLRALVQHLFLQFTEREELSSRSFRLDGRDALEVEQRAAIDGVSRHFIVTVLKKNACVYDFIHVDRGGDSAPLEASRAAFRRMVAGFSLVKEGS